MANILEFLRGVITEPEAQDEFHADPGRYVEKAGFVDLTGEDVVEAVLVLRRTLPEELSARLGVFEDDDELPASRPGPEETELDAAVRMLHFAITQSGTPVADEPIDVENELDTDLAEGPPKVARRQTRGSSVALRRFAEVLDAIVSDSKASFSGAVDQSTVSLTAIVEDSTSSLSEVVEQARSALAGVVVDSRTSLGAIVGAAATALDTAAAAARDAVADAAAAAEADVLQMRADGEAERVAARRDAERIRTEADNELQRAREQAEDSRRRADELTAATQVESDAVHAELAARRAEMRELEHQLKDRLSGIDSLFRTALGDQEGAAPPPK